jgi:hypothetical protein
MTILTPDNSKQETYQLEIQKTNKIYSILAIIISGSTTGIIIWILNTAK